MDFGWIWIGLWVAIGGFLVDFERFWVDLGVGFWWSLVAFSCIFCNFVWILEPGLPSMDTKGQRHRKMDPKCAD